MNRLSRLGLPVALFLFLLISTAWAQNNEATPAPPKEWRVGVAGAAPFVVDLDNAVEGLSVETWRVLAREINIEYRLERYASEDKALEDLAAGRLDAVVGPLNITSKRSETVSFSQPYYIAYQGLLSRDQRESPMQRLTQIAKHLFVGGSALMGVLLLVGGCFWLLERKVNPSHFSPEPKHGIGSGVWMALVTATTVGYGDKAPITLGGRMLAGMWMLITTVTVSSFTAWVATTLTVWSLQSPYIENPAQLVDKRVAVVADTASENFGRHFTSRIVKCKDVAEAVKLLEAGRVDVVVYDFPVLSFHMSRNPNLEVRLASSAYSMHDFGFAFPKNSPEVSRINVALLRLKENGTLRDIRHHWFHEPDDQFEHNEASMSRGLP